MKKNGKSRIQKLIDESSKFISDKVNKGSCAISFGNARHVKMDCIEVRNENTVMTILSEPKFIQHLKYHPECKIEDTSNKNIQFVRTREKRRYHIIAKVKVPTELIMDNEVESKEEIELWVARDWPKDKVCLGSKAVRAFSLEILIRYEKERKLSF